jgi:uncharacterized membrane protein
MLALRYVYVLALAVWLGGMLVLGALVAPMTFELLQASAGDTGRALAGQTFGAILSRFYNLAYACGALLVVTLTLMALLGPRPTGFAVRLIIAAAMLGAALYAGFVVLGDMDRIQQEVGVLPSRLAVEDARRVRFETLHQLSTRLMLANIAGGLVLLYWEARDHGR